jgi:hypothetical protein
VDSWRKRAFVKKHGDKRFNVSQKVFNGRGYYCSGAVEDGCPAELAEPNITEYRETSLAEFVACMNDGACVNGAMMIGDGKKKKKPRKGQPPRVVPLPVEQPELLFSRSGRTFQTTRNLTQPPFSSAPQHREALTLRGGAMAQGALGPIDAVVPREPERHPHHPGLVR